ncbi:hypothetical protein ACFWNQ_33620 [Streptomyces virginiae]
MRQRIEATGRAVRETRAAYRRAEQAHAQAGRTADKAARRGEELDRSEG